MLKLNIRLPDHGIGMYLGMGLLALFGLLFQVLGLLAATWMTSIALDMGWWDTLLITGAAAILIFTWSHSN